MESPTSHLPDKLIVFCTSASSTEAERIARNLVEGRLAACVSIISSVRSVFRWQNEVQTASEYLLIIKTTFARYPALQDAIVSMHSYEVPECIAIPVVAGLPAYLSWVEREVANM